MARRGNKRREDGRISVQVYVGRDSLGFDENGKEIFKRKYKTVYGRTQAEAEERANEIKAAMKKGLNVASDNDTFGMWAKRWLSIKEAEVSSGRHDVYSSHTKHLNRYLENAKITKLRTSDFQDIITDLSKKNPNTKKPMAKTTLKELRGTANQIMQLAVDNRVMDYNPVPATKITAPKKTKDARALTKKEQSWINETEHRAKRAAMIMMYAGLRRGEVIALTWNDIDIENRTITVNRTVERINNQFILKDTAKTDSSLRTIDIPQRLADFLENEKRESIYVCVTADNRMHTYSSWKRTWSSYLADLNVAYGDFSMYEKKYKSKFDKGIPFVIPKINPHWLRHTFATMLYLAGVDILTAKEQLGHSDTKTTLDIYTHLDAKYKRKSMNKLDEYLDPNEDDASQMQVK